jgi:hypothetical protein
VTSYFLIQHRKVSEYQILWEQYICNLPFNLLKDEIIAYHDIQFKNEWDDGKLGTRI